MAALDDFILELFLALKFELFVEDKAAVGKEAEEDFHVLEVVEEHFCDVNANTGALFADLVLGLRGEVGDGFEFCALLGSDF